MAFHVKTFYTRATTALVFVALLLGCVWYSYYSFIAFFTVVGFIGLYEFYKITEKLNARPHKIAGYILHSSLILGVIYFRNLIFLEKGIPVHIFLAFLFLIPSAFLFLFVIELFRKESALQNIAFTILALVYVSAPCVFLISMTIGMKIYTDPAFIPQRVLGMIFFIWINDTGAYLVGSFIGKHKLYEKISPNKTWEGTLGGIALCIALSFVVAHIFPQLALKHWIAISVIVAVFGTLGDLVESMLKRMAGVKDSGKLMPGHGGVLDRFDSLFFATPFVFCYLALMGLL